MLNSYELRTIELATKISRANENIDQLDTINTELRRGFPRVPDSVESMCSAIIALLGLTYRLIVARSLCRETDMLLDSAFQEMSNKTWYSPGRWNRESGYDSRSVDIDCNHSIAKTTYLLGAMATARRFKDRVSTIENLSSEIRAFLFDLIESHVANRKIKCFGYTDALSCLLYVFADKHDGRVSDENRLFGIVWPNLDQNPEHDLRMIRSDVLPIQDKSERKPSLVNGDRVYLAATRKLSAHAPNERSRFASVQPTYVRLHKKLVKSILNVDGAGWASSYRIFLGAIKFESVCVPSVSVWLKRKEISVHNVPTIPTGRPEVITQLGEVVVLRIACKFWNHGRFVDGLLLVANRESYHLELVQNEDLNRSNLQSVLDRLRDRIESNRKREEENARLRQSKRQQYARIAWAAKSIPVVTLNDSYAVGNCRPGTSQFVQDLGLPPEVEETSGRTLAKLWIKSGCPQSGLFANVIERLKTSTN